MSLKAALLGEIALERTQVSKRHSRLVGAHEQCYMSCLTSTRDDQVFSLESLNGIAYICTDDNDSTCHSLFRHSFATEKPSFDDSRCSISPHVLEDRGRQHKCYAAPPGTETFERSSCTIPVSVPDRGPLSSLTGLARHCRLRRRLHAVDCIPVRRRVKRSAATRRPAWRL